LFVISQLTEISRLLPISQTEVINTAENGGFLYGYRFISDFQRNWCCYSNHV